MRNFVPTGNRDQSAAALLILPASRWDPIAFFTQPAKRSVSPNAKGRRALVIKVPYVNDLVRMIKRKKEGNVSELVQEIADRDGDFTTEIQRARRGNEIRV